MVETNLPILYLREMVLLPYNEINLDLNEDNQFYGGKLIFTLELMREEHFECNKKATGSYF